MPSSSSRNDCRVYVGNLPYDIRSQDIEDLFYRFGKILDVDLKNRRGPPFAFVEFDDPRDAEDAVKGRHGYDFDGYQLRVEFPREGTRGRRARSRDGGSRSGRRGSGGRQGKFRLAKSSRSEYRVFVTGLPPTGSWQDLKDHMRKAGDVCFADVYKDKTGVVEFLRYEDMKYAIEELDDSRFRSHEGETSYIRVKEDSPPDGEGAGRSRSNSYSPRGRSDSRSHSQSRSGSRSRSRSRSPYDRR